MSEPEPRQGIDSIDVRNGYWSKSWQIPGTIYTICGYSRAAYRTGFYIKELKLMLDAGPQNFSSPESIMVTHKHDDHLAELALTLIPSSPDSLVATVYAPVSAFAAIAAAARGFPCLFKGLIPGDVRMIHNKNPMMVKVIKCDHSVDTISFAFSLIKTKLKSEFHGKKGKELKQLKMDGVNISEEILKKEFAFICDTSIHVFEMYPEIIEYPVIIVECTFLKDDEIQNAIDTKHIHWSQLEPIVAKHPEITFMLIHFSLRYGKDENIRDFFKEFKVKYPNLHCWA